MCLGVLLFQSPSVPRFLGALVVIAGGGSLFETFGKILVPDYALTVSVFTFVGEALLIVRLFWIAIKGSRPSESAPTPGAAPVRIVETVATTSWPRTRSRMKPRPSDERANASYITDMHGRSQR